MPWLSWIVSNVVLALVAGTGGLVRAAAARAARGRSHPVGARAGQAGDAAIGERAAG